ncbi:Uncharacterized protein family UPF0102 [Turneriella parva DSM 21527]|uniref:Uncharacterized protein family UPF0102 n=2 Tax=Turneriella TaxID=338321 RepID=I4BBY4_TURPD|nr:Uncharacterized protein family UPF0102 [Turneriella parva DSM 21527]
MVSGAWQAAKLGAVNAEENIAARFLRLAGYQVLSRNDRRFAAEIDLLVRSTDGSELCIVEIKRRRQHAGYPLISETQRERLVSAAGAIMQEIGVYTNVRLLLMVVDAERESAEIIGDISLA